jgi:threonine dehydratase
MTLDLDIANVGEARRVIDPCFLDTPQYEEGALSAAIGRRTLVKVETANPVRSFKGRGVSFALRDMPHGTTVVCASSGNFGMAVAYVGRARGLRVRVFATENANTWKIARIEGLGATVVRVGPDLAAARAAAEADAARHRVHLITDGTAPALAEGAATIGQEILRSGPQDTIVVPVGDGSLISGIGLWVRAHAPGTAIIGVNPTEAPTMRDSVRIGRPATAKVGTPFAEGISIPRPHSESLRRVRRVVDEIVVVSDDRLLGAMRLAARHLSVLVEPAGAAGLAAIAAGLVPGERVATVVTGANPSPTAVGALIDRLARRPAA